VRGRETNSFRSSTSVWASSTASSAARPRRSSRSSTTSGRSLRSCPTPQELPAPEIREQFAQAVQILERAAHGPGRRSPKDRAFYAAMLGTATSSAAERIFACYEHEALRHHPTDNLQEDHYGTLRRVERRRTGQRSAVRQLTQRGGIRAKAIALTRAFDPKILVTLAADAFTRSCSPTSNTCLLAARTPVDKSLHNRRCYVRDPDAFLQRLERRE
jgi:hypothetical protein